MTITSQACYIIHLCNAEIHIFISTICIFYILHVRCYVMFFFYLQICFILLLLMLFDAVVLMCLLPQHNNAAWELWIDKITQARQLKILQRCHIGSIYAETRGARR